MIVSIVVRVQKSLAPISIEHYFIVTEICDKCPGLKKIDVLPFVRWVQLKDSFEIFEVFLDFHFSRNLGKISMFFSKDNKQMNELTKEHIEKFLDEFMLKKVLMSKHREARLESRSKGSSNGKDIR